MRVIAGGLGGRQFDAPKGHRTHPMSEKVRGALFSALGDIEGLSVLDTFAGSGALSFEAISRGAIEATAIDNDKKAYDAIVLNMEKLGVEQQIKATRANVASWSDNNPDKTFDLVFVAPPYDNLQLNTVQKMTRHVSKGGLLVLDWPGKLEPPNLEGIKIKHSKNYGDAQLAFYRKTG
jgi:16S rRNA (guanine966-N2)-methyltransferase